MSSLDCPFCKKLAALDELPADELLWRFPHSVALLGPWQFYRGYCVLISRVHARELSELDDTVRRAYLDEMCLLARAIERAFSPHKLNYELLGNQVPHLHWHLFPRSLDDSARLSPVWLALDAAERDERLREQMKGDPGQRHDIIERLRESLNSLNAPHS